jgi:murein DD-endopeptidase MepM/ murein hydrolase activator NlpD
MKARDEQMRTQAADDAARAELAAAEAEVAEAEKELARIERELASLREVLGDFARRAYQMGPYVELEMVLDAKDPSDFTSRLAAVNSVAASSNANVTRMAHSRAQMQVQQTKLEGLRELAEEKKDAAADRLAQARNAAEGATAAKRIVDNLIKQQEAALSVAQQHRTEVKSQYDKLQAEQDRLQKQIAAAAARLEKSTGVKTNPKVSAGDGGGTNGGGNGNAGGYDSGSQWYFPLPGYSIGSDAGWRFHPILHYTRCHAGADMGAPSGAPIHAVESGTVIMAGWNGGYGNFTVIAHGGGVTSGYGHQSRIIVSSGQHVSRGQVIGYVGTTGLSTGPHLHFEARINGAPYSPKGWFGQGPKVQVCT